MAKRLCPWLSHGGPWDTLAVLKESGVIALSSDGGDGERTRSNSRTPHGLAGDGDRNMIQSTNITEHTSLASAMLGRHSSQDVVSGGCMTKKGIPYFCDEGPRFVVWLSKSALCATLHRET